MQACDCADGQVVDAAAVVAHGEDQGKSEGKAAAAVATEAGGVVGQLIAGVGMVGGGAPQIHLTNAVAGASAGGGGGDRRGAITAMDAIRIYLAKSDKNPRTSLRYISRMPRALGRTLVSLFPNTSDNPFEKLITPALL